MRSAMERVEEIKRENGRKKKKNGLFRWKIGKLEKKLLLKIEICIRILLADR